MFPNGLPEFTSVNADVTQLCAELSEGPTTELLDKLHEYLSDDTNLLRRNESRGLFMWYVCNTNTDRTIKHDFMERLTRNNEDFTLFYSIVLDCLQDVLFDYEIEQTLTASQNMGYILSVVYVFYQMCSHVDEGKTASIVETALPLYNIVVQSFLAELRENFDEAYYSRKDNMIMTVCQAMHQIAWAYSKSYNIGFEKYALQFLDFSYWILDFERTTTDMKMKCALVMLRVLQKLPKEEVESFKFVVNPMLEVIKKDSDPERWLCGKSFTYPYLLKNITTRVIVLSALHGCTPITDQVLWLVDHNLSLYQCLFLEFLDSTERPMCELDAIAEASRVLVLMSKNVGNVPLGTFSSVFDKSIVYIISYFDCYIDVVRRNVNTFLGDIVKASCFHFAKGVGLYITKLLSYFNVVKMRRVDFVTTKYLSAAVGTSYLLSNDNNLRCTLLRMFENPRVSVYARQAYETLMQFHYKESTFLIWVNTWLMPVLYQLRNGPEEFASSYESILTRAFQMDQTVLRTMFPVNQMGSPREWCLLLKCLNVSRTSKNALDLQSYDHNVYWWGLVERKKLKLFAFHRRDEVRLGCLKAMVETARTTEYFSEFEMEFLVDFYYINACTPTTHTMKEIASMYRKAVCRYFAGLEVINRDVDTARRRTASIPQSESMCLQTLERMQTLYQSFMTKLVTMMIGQLVPNANHYRRSLALENLAFLQRHLTSDWSSVWKKDDIDNLKLILHDSYESNKRMAATLLTKFTPAKLKLDDSTYYARFFSEALTYASDIKPSKSLSAAYMFQVCCIVPVSLVGSDVRMNDVPEQRFLNVLIRLTNHMARGLTPGALPDINVNSPRYGILLCIRHLIKNCNKGTWLQRHAVAYAKIYKFCQKILVAAMPIVCNPAPEGYLPEQLDSELPNTAETSQKLLVFAWRTVKEVTLLFSEFVYQDMEVAGDFKFLTKEDHVEIGERFLDIFVKAKHRGVFEQAYVGFNTLCQFYWRHPDKDISVLPEKWLQRAMDLVKGAIVDKDLSPTRRSAGMPFLIMSLLNTDPSVYNDRCHSTIKELIEIAMIDDSERTESRIHALNILRFLFRDAKLTECITCYLEETAEVAIRGMQKQDWGIRNSSTLLFSMLFSKLFGVERTQDIDEVSPKNKMTFKAFQSRFPKFVEFLIDTLKVESENSNSLILHPVLMIFSRLYPCTIDQSPTRIGEAVPFIKKAMSHPCYETRKLAARAAVALMGPKSCRNAILMNFHRISNGVDSNNELHGLLMEVDIILKFMGHKMELPINSMIFRSIYIVEGAGTKFSHHCVALYLDILTYFCSRCDLPLNVSTLRKLLMTISNLMGLKDRIVTGRINFEPAMFMTTITILMLRLDYFDNTFQTINFDLEYHMEKQEDLLMKTFVLQFILYVNIRYNEFNMEQPPVYIRGDLKIPDAIIKVVNRFDNPAMCAILLSTHGFMVDYLKRTCDKMKKPKKFNDRHLLHLVLLPYYPCAFLRLGSGRRQKEMNSIINLTKCDREEVYSAAVVLLSAFLRSLDKMEIMKLNFERLLPLLTSCAQPQFASCCRLAVCHFLLQCRFLYYTGQIYTSDPNVGRLFYLVFMLLEDDLLEIRNEMAQISDEDNMVSAHADYITMPWECTPEKSASLVMTRLSEVLPQPDGISFIFHLGLRHLHDPSKDPSQLFERSELNNYAEGMHLLQLSTKMLNKKLWSYAVPDHNYDRSMFFGEQALMLTTTLMDAFHEINWHFMHPKTHVAVSCAFKSIVHFLENNAVNTYKKTFTEHFTKKILLYLEKQVYEGDFSAVKRMFSSLYEPLLLPMN